MVIRRLTASDAQAYLALRLRGMVEHPQAFTSSAEEEADRSMQWAQDRLRPDPKRQHDFFLGAFDVGDLVGIVGVQGRYRPKERHNATVVGMYVAPEAAGKGVGRALMQELLQQVTALDGLEQLDLTVTAGSDRAQALYAQCGFTAWGSLPRAIKVGDHYLAKIHMCKQLR